MHGVDRDSMIDDARARSILIILVVVFHIELPSEYYTTKKHTETPSLYRRDIDSPRSIELFKEMRQ